ncbi:WRC domain [Dillenia turbinata]|uniref:WRC domain n=1 Tax=Dillenia turbinata TaxID=194707 RepID=A0AAN8W5W5_9MAGN
MRIRKRAVPLPLSLLSPVPLSDPHLNHHSSPPSSLLQPQPRLFHQPTPAKTTNPDKILSGAVHHTPHSCSKPSDPPNQPDLDHHFLTTIIGEEPIINIYKSLEMEEEEKDERLKEGEMKSNDTRKDSMLGAEAAPGVLALANSSHQVGRSWYEEDKVVPLKKKRGSLERVATDDDDEDYDEVTEKEKKWKMTMKTKMETRTNKKLAQQRERRVCSSNTNTSSKLLQDQAIRSLETKRGFDHDNHNNNINIDMNTMNTSVTKKGRGGAIMEGSRCSRVNGRGWRCCQPTLVGYSLCEHHLGKGRLRSMTSVRSRSTNIGASSASKSSTYNNNNNNNNITISAPTMNEGNRNKLEERDGHESEEEEEDDMVSKMGKKTGIVKARSISSLLGQTRSNANAVAAADHENKLYAEVIWQI